ncbi:MAG: hypothetical protein IJS14_13880 [Lentisphaeria bacterium]|nr:hypothetical protein [Lentisphaeria bacterium]
MKRTPFFATSKPNISIHVFNMLNEKRLQQNSVVKCYLTTAADREDMAELKVMETRVIRRRGKGAGK